MKIIIVGRGRMGKMIAACAEEAGIDVAGLYGHETAASLAAAIAFPAVLLSLSKKPISIFSF